MRVLWVILLLAGAGVMFWFSATSTPLNGGWVLGIIAMSVAAYKLIPREAK